MKIDWVIVGAGLTGSAFARAMADRGFEVLVVEKRLELGGNCADRYDASGVLIHPYGPHIFHTSDRAVWSFLSRFTEWRPYTHYVRGFVDGRWVPIPFNLEALRILYPEAEAADLSRRLIDAYGFGAKVAVLELLSTQTDEKLRRLGEYVYDRVFLKYTIKQWGLRPEQLDPSVTSRVPVVISLDGRYFTDQYQALPREGYTEMTRRMLAHPRIRVVLNAGHKDLSRIHRRTKTFFTGRIDEYFDERLGRLPYRSVEFKFDRRNVERVQEVGTQNYPNDHEFTRTTEFKHLTGQDIGKTTVICYEYPQAYVPGENEPYYPIPVAENRALYGQYAEIAKREATHVVFAGRLGDYKYYNMDQAVARALAVADSVTA